MDGLCRAAGGLWACLWRGRTVWAEPLRLWSLGAAETLILTRRESLLDKVSGAMENLRDRPKMAKSLYDQAYKDMRSDRKSRTVTVDEMFRWLTTREGIAFSLWACLRPTIDTLEEAERQVLDAADDELARFCRARDIASGIDAMANMDWKQPIDESKLRRPGRTGRKDEKGRPASWRRIYHDLATHYGWSSDQINQLTLYGAHMYNAPDEELGGVTSMAPEDAMNYRRQLRNGA